MSKERHAHVHPVCLIFRVAHVRRVTEINAHVRPPADTHAQELPVYPTSPPDHAHVRSLIAAQAQGKYFDIDNSSGQGYDNGTNMAGKTNGVQSKILNINPRAVFVPCGCHCRNLVIGDAVRSCKESMQLFGIIQCFYVLFSGPIKRWKILSDHISGLTLKPLCTTRWECHINCLKPLRHNFGEIQEALIVLSDETHIEPNICHEANTLSQQIVEFKFIVLESGFESSFQLARELEEKSECVACFQKAFLYPQKKALFGYESQDEPLNRSHEDIFIMFWLILLLNLWRSVLLQWNNTTKYGDFYTI
ncbi:zinc finger MYM-type 1-like [Pelobates cultripes]|uniref:Zinc finger MYM-type 1-like n=1 Tax=Pelobates cultripes TaxID=61616 RepID=A0AAD1SZS9_PELCU|nr:zinc finger MYM-type 1-like [Pelobates cultripes]